MNCFKRYSTFSELAPVTMKRRIDKAIQARKERKWSRWVIQSLDAHRIAAQAVPFYLLEAVLLPKITLPVSGICYTASFISFAFGDKKISKLFYRNAQAVQNITITPPFRCALGVVSIVSPDLTIRVFKFHKMREIIKAYTDGAALAAMEVCEELEEL